MTANSTSFDSDTGAAAGSVDWKFKPEFVEQARKLAQLGAVDVEIADFFEVSVRTIYRWKLDHSEFGEALEVGKEPADHRVTRAVFQRAVGYDYVEQQAIKVKTGKDTEEVVVVDVQKHMAPDGTTGIWWQKNRLGWTDKQVLEHTGPDGGAIMAKVTVDAVVARLAKLDDDC